MSADLNFEATLKGSKDEIKSMLKVLQGYEGGSPVYLDFLGVALKKNEEVGLGNMSDTELDEYLSKENGFKGKVYVSAAGPFGRYGTLESVGIYEALAETAPNAKFEACIFGFTTGQNEDFEGSLKDGKLYLEYKYIVDDYLYDDDDEEVDEDAWSIEKSIYDPISKKYEQVQ